MTAANDEYGDVAFKPYTFYVGQTAKITMSLTAPTESYEFPGEDGNYVDNSDPNVPITWETVMDEDERYFTMNATFNLTVVDSSTVKTALPNFVLVYDIETPAPPEPSEPEGPELPTT